MTTFDTLPDHHQEVKWRVKTVIAEADASEDFSTQHEAEEYYKESLQDLEDTNDRVVLYRIKTEIATYKDGRSTKQSYQDVYKSDIADYRGSLIHLRNRAPKTWQEAKTIKETESTKRSGGRKRKKAFQKHISKWIGTTSGGKWGEFEFDEELDKCLCERCQGE